MKHSKIKVLLALTGLLLIIGSIFLMRSNLESAVEPLNVSLYSEKEISLQTKGLAMEALAEPYEGDFELPIEGATGYASVEMPLRERASQEADTLIELNPGDGFRIISEEGEWWQVENDTDAGWILHQYAFINLPDVIPSIIYDNTNGYASVFRSSGEDIPEVTDEVLYNSLTYNKRLEKEEYMMPVLYSMSKKIYDVQQEALENDDTLILNEGYRPFNVQEHVSEQLANLAESNSNVREGINTPPWSISWFIASGISNHQRGYAIDVSLASVEEKETVNYGNYTVDEFLSYTEYDMPTPIHELSNAGVVFAEVVTPQNDIAWKEATLSDTMTEGAITLQEYAANAGLTPLASEWWHFNDLEARDETIDNSSDGRFIISELFSIPPID